MDFHASSHRTEFVLLATEIIYFLRIWTKTAQLFCEGLRIYTNWCPLVWVGLTGAGGARGLPPVSCRDVLGPSGKSPRGLVPTPGIPLFYEMCIKASSHEGLNILFMHTKHFIYAHQGLPSLAAQMVKNLPTMREIRGLIPGLGRFPWRSKWLPTPVFFLGTRQWTEEPGRL